MCGSLDGAVVDVYLVDDELCVGEAVGIDGESDVLCGDVHASAVLDGDVCPVVTVLELGGASAHGESDQLASESDSVDGHLGRQVLDGLHSGCEHLGVGGVSGTGGYDYSLDTGGHDVLCRCVIGEHDDIEDGVEVPEDRCCDSAVDDSDGEVLAVVVAGHVLA